MAQRGRPFQAGNKFGKGRPRGSRNKTTIATQELLNSHSEAILRKALVMALQGEVPLLRAFLDRVVPVQRHSPVAIGKLPAGNAAEISKTSEEVLNQVAAGKLMITDGEGLLKLLELRRRTIETEELEKRISALESKA